MGVEIITASREVHFGYNDPHGRPKHETFQPKKLSKIPSDQLAAMRAKLDSDKKSVFDIYLESGVLVHVNKKVAQGMADGSIEMPEEELTPAQMQAMGAKPQADAEDAPNPSTPPPSRGRGRS